ncbi:PAS-domain containing protein [Novispirillum sp. DQ9]|uniref:hybrid sensor histidine kinase/response regulator n=1 Tax=Novispirillum sp. DQ9 TaxID=3398612 RepID=UPI003C7A6A82
MTLLLGAMTLVAAVAVALLLVVAASRQDEQARLAGRTVAAALADDIRAYSSFDQAAIAAAGARHGLVDLRLSADPPPPGGVADGLSLREGEGGYLVWTVDRPGRALLNDVSPPLFAVLLVILGLGGLIIARTHQVTRNLADTTSRLADSEERYSAAAADSETLRGLLMDAVNSIDEGFVLFDAEGRLVVCNDRYREIYPTVSDLLVPGVPFSDILAAAAERLGVAGDASLRHWIESRLNRHLEHDRPVEARLSDGRWYRISERPTRTGGIVKVLMDITDTRAHAQALATKSEVLETTFEAMAQAVCVFDAGLTLAAWNHRFAELAEYPADLLVVGTPLAAFTVVDAGRRVVALPADGWQATTTNGTAREVTLPSGRILEVRHDPLPRGGFVATFTDATAHHQAETALRHSQKMDAIGQLAGGIAHEFNNMLTSIGGFARMAQRTPDNVPRVTLCLGEITKAADRAAQLTAQLLDFSRRTDRDSRVPVHLKTLARDLTSFLRPLLGEHVDVEVAVHDSDLVVLADQAKLTQAIVNLCINARDAMPGGGTITMDVAPAEADAGLASRHPGLTAQSFARLRVADGGTGIAPDVLPRIFEPFFTTKEQGKGTGLGLPMVYSTVEQLGGAVEVETAPGRGTVFTLYLPRVVHSGPAPEPGTERAAVNGAGVTVLVAEDEDSVRELISMTLRDAGFNVIAAADGAEAAVLYERHGEDCAALITDVVMPKLDGPALARRLLERDRGMKVVLMSGYDVHDQGAALAEAPGRRFLRKPVDPDVLLATLRHLLDEDAPIHEEDSAP